MTGKKLRKIYKSFLHTQIKSKNALKKNSRFFIIKILVPFQISISPQKEIAIAKNIQHYRHSISLPGARVLPIEEISLRGWGSVRDKLKFFANEPVLLGCEYLSSFEPATLYPILLAQFTLHAPRDSRYLLRASDAP